MKYEYMLEVIPELYGEEKMMELLNARGKEGWEAVHFFSSEPTLGGISLGVNEHKIIFKRCISC
jgi:hypothetical protein